MDDEAKIAVFLLAAVIFRDGIARGTPQGPTPETLAKDAIDYATVFVGVAVGRGLLPHSGTPTTPSR